MTPENPTRPPLLVIVGQTPPPWHGQAVATQQLFDHDWPGFETIRIRMEFSGEMEEIGRFHFRKVIHMLDLWTSVRIATREHRDGILLYPPASPNWVPILRDFILLPLIRNRFGTLVYIYHAGGVGEWCAKSRFRRWIARIAYGQADLNLEVSKECPAPHEVLGARQWAWTPYGVHVPALGPEAKTRSGPTVVLFVGSLQEGKGVIEILKTASLLKKQGKERDFLFRIVGGWFSREFEEAARHLLAELQLEKMVEFPGQLTGSEKWQAYSEADIFFFPTHYASEAFPLVLIEAIGSGLPVVTTRWRGIPDLLDGCSVATLCEIRSPAEYVDALLALTEQANEGMDFVKEARSFYEERYLPENFLAQIQSLVSATALGTESHAVGESSGQTGRRTMLPIQLQPYATKEASRGGGVRLSLDTSGSTAPPSAAAVAPSSSYKILISIYLADQNPGHDRSFGISRMSHVVMEALQEGGQLRIETITSRTSQQPPDSVGQARMLPWGTRSKWVRLMTDHFHPLFQRNEDRPDLHYFPKGYLPLTSASCHPSVVTIHDTIIQYDADHYPKWRSRWEYVYWAKMLKHTLRQADRILTVSESSKRQIQVFMDRHRIQSKEITVTYEPCAYEKLPQPVNPEKENHVIHLASREPHKRTAHLVRWWHEAENLGRELPTLQLIGTVPPEVEGLLASARTIVKRPFLDDSALQAAYRQARALILPSEIEGFGLPALEAYYLGTPVCYVKGTSVEEVLAVATEKGGFVLENMESLFTALEEVMAMPPEEVRRCGLKLRETYAADKVAERMFSVFHSVKN